MADAPQRTPAPFTKLPASVAKLAAAATSRALGRVMPTPRASEPQELSYQATQAYTYFTMGDGRTYELYQAQSWVRIKLVLETAGPVAIGTKAELTPVLGGVGRLLETDVEMELWLTRGSTVYIAAEAANRVGVTIEPFPWLQTLSQQISWLGQMIGKLAQSLSGRGR